MNDIDIFSLSDNVNLKKHLGDFVSKEKANFG